MSTLRTRWMTFWFAPTPPTDLGVCRFLFFGIFALYYLRHDLSAWGDTSSVFWMPIPLFQYLHLHPLSREALAGLQFVWRAALIGSCVGFATRISTMVAFVLGIYFIGLPHNFGKTHNLDAIVLLTMGVMAVARCGDGWSLDSLLWARPPTRPAERRSGEYTWPIRLAWLLLTSVFFGAGISKLRHSGLAWVFSENLAVVLTQSNAPWGFHIAKHSVLCKLIAALTVLGETSAPLALVSPALRLLIVPGLFFMQLGIWFVMGVNFKSFMVCYLFWVSWRELGLWLTAPLRVGGRHTLIFDGLCGLCNGTVAWIRHLDVMGRVDYHDAVHEWSVISRRFPQLNQAACLNDMHLVTRSGRVLTGFDAYRALAWTLPCGWIALPFLYLPGIGVIGRRVYASIAARRARNGCHVPVHSIVVDRKAAQ